MDSAVIQSERTRETMSKEKDLRDLLLEKASEVQRLKTEVDR